eukprot:Colp12_sorted_trinity150504_noHs@19240
MAFNAESDVQSLKEAINGRDEDALIKVLSNRDHSQRQEVRKLYATAYESDLVTDLQSVLGLNCEDAVLSLFMTSPQYDAYSLYKAMRGADIDEDTLIEILISRTAAQLNVIMEHFQSPPNPNGDPEGLAEWIIWKTTGDLKEYLLFLLKGNRSENVIVDEAQTAQDACELFEVGPGHLSGSGKSALHHILASRSAAELKDIDTKYKDLTKLDGLVDAIGKEFQGTMKKAYLSTLQALWQPSKYFATRVHDAICGMGANNALLTRVIVTRGQIDIVNVKQEYSNLYKQDMVQSIEEKISGFYKKLLVELLSH